MEVRLRELLLGYCLDHLEQVSCRTLGRVARLAGLNFSRSHYETSHLIQQRLLQERVIERLAPNTLGITLIVIL
jgi:hypothetical protein